MVGDRTGVRRRPPTICGACAYARGGLRGRRRHECWNCWKIAQKFACYIMWLAGMGSSAPRNVTAITAEAPPGNIGNKSPRGRGQVATPAHKAEHPLVRARRRIEQFGQANFDPDVLLEPAGGLEVVKHVAVYCEIRSDGDLELEMAP